MCLMFRVGDVRKSQLLKPHVQVLFLKKLLKTKEAIVSQRNLRVTYNTNENTAIRLSLFFSCHWSYVTWSTKPVRCITSHRRNYSRKSARLLLFLKPSLNQLEMWCKLELLTFQNKSSGDTYSVKWPLKRTQAEMKIIRLISQSLTPLNQ